jgi:acetate kinase
MPGNLLVLNSGSSSLKFALYDADAADEPGIQLRGQITGLDAIPSFRVCDADGRTLEDRKPAEADADFGQQEALQFLMDWLEPQTQGQTLWAAGHRVVHGGAGFAGPVRVDAEALKKLEALVPLAPLHQPHNLAPIRSLSTSDPDLVQVACFDTAFHHSQSPLERRLALPRRFEERGVMRYGFHGLSYEYIAETLGDRVGRRDTGRVIVAHLGSGASLAALQDGVSVGTTMGFTALDGLPMSTRSGSLDPGAVLYLLKELGMSLDAVTTLLYEESGLLGVSGISGDMRTLLESQEPAAREAVDLFVHRTVREMGALTAILGGLDHLVFTGGIGERAAVIRERVCRGLEWLGVALDLEANTAHAERIDRNRSRIAIWVIPTDEERMIARHTLRLLRQTWP